MQLPGSRAAKLASARSLIQSETGRDPSEAQIGIILTGGLTYIVGAFTDDEMVLIPIRFIVPLRRLPDEDLLTLPPGTKVVRRSVGAFYVRFELVTPDARLRLHIAKQWRELIGDLNRRSAGKAT